MFKAVLGALGVAGEGISVWSLLWLIEDGGSFEMRPVVDIVV